MITILCFFTLTTLYPCQKAPISTSKHPKFAFSMPSRNLILMQTNDY